MASLETIRKLTIVASTQGAEQAAGALRQVEDAHRGVGDAAVVSARATEESSKKQLSAAAAYERLRKSIDDQYRAQRQIEAGQKIINQALGQGHIDALQASYSMELLNKKYAVNTTAAQKVASVTGLAGYQMRNLGFQVNDVVSGLAMGQSPFTIMAQQGGQVVQILQSAEGGLAGIAKRVAGAIGPWGLLAAGIAAAGAAAFTFYKLASSDSRTLEQSLEEHARLLAVVKDRYNEAADAAKGLTLQTQNVTVLQALQAEFELRQRLAEQVTNFASGAASRIVGPGMDASAAVPLPEDVSASYRGFIVLLRELQDTVNKGATPDFVKFREEVAKLGRDGSQDIQKLAVEWIKLAEQPADIQQSIERLQAMRAVVDGLGDSVARAALGMKELSVADPLKTAGDAMQKLIQMAPEANKALLTQQKVTEAQATYTTAITQWSRAVDSGNLSSAEFNRLQADAARKLAVARGEITAVKQEVTKGANAYDTLLQRTKDRTEELQLEAQYASKTADEVIKLKIAHDLERAAKSANKEVTEEMRAEWAKLGQDRAEAVAFTNEINKWTRMTENFTNTLVDGLVEGKSLMEALTASAGQLGQAMTQIGTKQISQSLVSGAQKAIPALGSTGANLAVGGLGVLISLWAAHEEKQKQQVEKQRQAWEAWENAADELAAFTARANGQAVSSIGNQMSQANSEAQRLVRLREEAIGSRSDAQSRADPVIQQIFADLKKIGERLKGEFRDSFQPTIEAMRSGLGMDSPLFQGLNGVKQSGERIKEFVADAMVAFQGGPQASIAAAAGREQLLGMLNPAEELSEVQSALAKLEGTAKGLQEVLVSLGFSASETAQAIDERMTAALDKMRQSFDADLQRRLNEASGKGFLNSIFDLFERDAKDRADAAALGRGTGGLDTLLGLDAQKIVNEAQLAGEQFQEMLSLFPRLRGVVQEFSAAAQDAAEALTRSTEDLAKTLQSLDDRLFTAGNDASTITGALAAFDRAAERERAEEVRQGGEALLRLEEVLSAERLNIMDDFARRAIEQERQVAARRQGFQDRAFAAGNDPNSFSGAMAAFVRRAQQEMQSEMDAGGDAIVDLQAALQAEQLDLVQGFYDQQLEIQRDAIEQQENAAREAAEQQERIAQEARQFLEGVTRRIKEFINSLNSTPAGGLSPQAQLANAQSAYNTQRTLAQSGNRDALEGITQYAQTLLDASKAYYGSSASHQTLLNTVKTQLEALPSQVSVADVIKGAIETQTTNIRQFTVGNNGGDLLSELMSIDTNADGIITAAELQAALDAKGVSNVTTAVGNTTANVIANTTAISGVTGAINTQVPGVTGAINTQVPAVTTAVNTQVPAVTTAVNTQVPAVTTAVNTVDGSVDATHTVLSAIQGLQSTATAQLNYISQTTVQGTGAGQFGNTMMSALNKIVYNTWAIANNTIQGWQAPSAISSQYPNAQLGMLAEGGWVRGPGSGISDSINAGNAWVSNGEFVVNAMRAQAANSWLPEYNRTGRMPANDNGAQLSVLIGKVEHLTKVVAVGSEHVANAAHGTTAAIRRGSRQKLLAA